MPLTPQRRFVTPEPGEDWNALAQRVFPDVPAEGAVQQCAAGIYISSCACPGATARQRRGVHRAPQPAKARGQ